MIEFLIGLLVGIVITFIAMVWDAMKDKRAKFYFDDNYKIHLTKKKWLL